MIVTRSCVCIEPWCGMQEWLTSPHLYHLRLELGKRLKLKNYNAPANPGTKSCKNFNSGKCYTSHDHLGRYYTDVSLPFGVMWVASSARMPLPS